MHRPDHVDDGGGLRDLIEGEVSANAKHLGGERGQVVVKALGLVGAEESEPNGGSPQPPQDLVKQKALCGLSVDAKAPEDGAEQRRVVTVDCVIADGILEGRDGGDPEDLG